MTATKQPSTPVYLLIDALRAGLPARGTVLERSYIRAVDDRMAFWQWRIVDCGSVYAPLDYAHANPGESHGELLRVEPINLEVRAWDPNFSHDEEAVADKLRSDSHLAHATDPTVKPLTHREARDAARAQAPGAWLEWESADLSYTDLFSRVRVVSSLLAPWPIERGKLDFEEVPPIANAARSTP